ncbi:hypothetical protein GF327_04750 [Candidatus Woesearchaeota archaeon]|nr:hypothetical protein [Candidatus Woesearchaeota archaeon]
MMQPKFKEIDGFIVRGMRIETTTKNSRNKTDCPKVWKKFLKSDAAKNADEFFGVCVEKNNHEFTYIAGIRNDKQADELEEVKIPESRYAVFVHDKGLNKISETWDYAYSKWLFNSGFEHNKKGISFERYETSEDGDIKKIEIYVPVR